MGNFFTLVAKIALSAFFSSLAAKAAEEAAKWARNNT